MQWLSLRSHRGAPRHDGAVSDQWRLCSRLEEERAIEGYIAYLEYVEGPDSIGKYLDKDSLGEGEEAYEGAH